MADQSLIYNQLTGWPGLALRHWRAKPSELPEYTSSSHMLTIPLEGAAYVESHSPNGTCVKVDRSPGSVCLIPSGQPVALRFDEEVEGATIYLNASYVAKTAADIFETDQIELHELPQCQDSLLEQIGLALLSESKSPQPEGNLYVASLAQTLVMHLLKNYSNHDHRSVPASGGLTGPRLTRAKDFINAHLEGDLTLDAIAAAAGLSAYHCARAFKQTTGLTPQQYLWEQRIERAKRILKNSDLPLTEVAALTGFKNQSHFTTVFRRLTEVTPKVWRDLFSD